MDESPVLLSSYDAKRCQRRIHNEHDPTIDKMPWQPDDALQRRLKSGRDFEAEVFTAIKAALRPERYKDLSVGSSKQQRIADTLAAMAAGVEVILGGWLPDDEAGGRTGHPDLLLQMGKGTYVPGDVKWHKAVQASTTGSLDYSTPSAPHQILNVIDYRPRATAIIGDYLQLAHYWRMLESIGRAPLGPARGFIVGTDRLDLIQEEMALTWLRLDLPIFETFSRSEKKVKRTALERYDFEHGIRIEIARVAESRTGADGDPDALVNPVFTQECDSCPWYDYCLGIAGNAASAHITTGRLDAREWRALAQLGVQTLDDLADLHVDDVNFLANYCPEVTHQSKALDRLKTAIRRANMIRAGVTLERVTTGPLDLPRADVEVDFDIEDAEGFVYLWGTLIRDRDSEPAYGPIVSWEPMEEASQASLAQTFVTWLRGVRDQASAEGKSVLAYHYSSHEISALNRILGEEAFQDLKEVFVDLRKHVEAHYFGAQGLGLKHVARAFHFDWRDDDPSGLSSQTWYNDATANEDPFVASAARERLLAYNEDDVRATLAVREGMFEPSPSPAPHGDREMHQAMDEAQEDGLATRERAGLDIPEAMGPDR